MNRSYKTSKGTELPLLNLRGKEYLEVKYRLVWFREDHPDWSIETELISVTDVSAYAKATIRDEKGRTIATSHKFETIQGFPDFIEKSETGAIGRALALIGYGTQFCADELDEGNRIVDAPANPVVRHSNSNRVVRNPAKAAAVEAKAKQQKEQQWSPVEAIADAEPAASTATDDAATEETATAPAATPVTAKAAVPTPALSVEAEAPPAPAAAASKAGGGMEPGDYLISFGRKYKGKKLKEIPKAEIESYIKWLETSDVRPGTPLSSQVQFLKNAFDKMYSVETANTSV